MILGNLKRLISSSFDIFQMLLCPDYFLLKTFFCTLSISRKESILLSIEI